MSITQFTMEEVRCFGEQQTLEIRPLTFLVGENSTGKTTALACFHVLANYLRDKGLDFNSDPYSLGTFKNIVRNSTKKEKVFKLGFVSRNNNKDVEVTVEFLEKEGRIEPAVSSMKVKFFDGEVYIKIADHVTARINLSSFDKNRFQIDCRYDILGTVGFSSFLSALRDPSLGVLEGDTEGKNILAKYLDSHGKSDKDYYKFWNIWSGLSIFSTAPIRSRPKRTYDPKREFNDPEGGDVPMFLMRIEATQNEEWEALKQQLVEFGKSSGLFQNIEIRTFEQTLGDPFQLQFKVRGPNCNIIDVGYGVSQILPILVQILNSDLPPSTSGLSNFFLLQQPEVHLHPKAQAELSSLLAKLANQGNQSFIIETHSDNMIDRARIDIMKGNISPEDVSLIYFEPVKNIVKVHNIGFDEMGNLIGVPTHYRNFFLKESKRLMGFKE